MLEHKAGKEEAVYRHIMKLQKEKEKKMENKEIIKKLNEFFDNWIDGIKPKEEDYETMDKILNELRKREENENNRC